LPSVVPRSSSPIVQSTKPLACVAAVVGFTSYIGLVLFLFLVDPARAGRIDGSRSTSDAGGPIRATMDCPFPFCPSQAVPRESCSSPVLSRSLSERRLIFISSTYLQSSDSQCRIQPNGRRYHLLRESHFRKSDPLASPALRSCLPEPYICLSVSRQRSSSASQNPPGSRLTTIRLLHQDPGRESAAEQPNTSADVGSGPFKLPFLLCSSLEGSAGFGIRLPFLLLC
jgi:hypothetical protein